jgi:hypothetical protein
VSDEGERKKEVLDAINTLHAQPAQPGMVHQVWGVGSNGVSPKAGNVGGAGGGGGGGLVFQVPQGVQHLHISAVSGGGSGTSHVPDDMHAYRLLLQVRNTKGWWALPKNLRNEILRCIGEDK